MKRGREQHVLQKHCFQIKIFLRTLFTYFKKLCSRMFEHCHSFLFYL
ncbi:hypothetical protein D920_03145 [Enterococcus faecalis 13-SD-W-01]|nr:hypothetical protein D920_03145 [Enterococcus faecalis 13-SD-W-01]